MLNQYSSANSGESTSIIVQAGYLVRTADIKGTNLYINGDLNATVPLRVIGIPSSVKDLYFNNLRLKFNVDKATGDWSSALEYRQPEFTLPDLASLDW
jgi:hypothetical protein